jgi:mitochondrial import inner membrane translocase subunit TIM21
MSFPVIPCMFLLVASKMSPNTVFSRALDQVRSHHEVTSRFGTPIRGYGRDHGGKRVGRRNFIEHTEYTSDEDGSKRTRVRFNLEGPHGQGFVFAEVSSAMPSGEFVYCKLACLR